MARNALWILERCGGRALLSAHNGHVSRAGLLEVPGYGTIQSIGRALDGLPRAPARVVLGTAFGRGGFWAFGAAGGGLQTFEVEAPLTDSVEAALLAAGIERPSLIDLRALPADGPVREFFARRRPAALIGGAWDPASWNDPAQALQTALPEQYDLLLFVPEVTPAERP
jgi:erythromycin esterase-like protein